MTLASKIVIGAVAAEADAALTRNQTLAADIEALGDGISVGLGTPCPEGQDRALIQVTYGWPSPRARRAASGWHDAAAGVTLK
ncbi:hypothetical protein [Micromonospora sp. CPCC 206061]|uniref:hypothetical protein n=1 Tax=Micromonospora sp. CPCC 206061 TaxID=3122410 RepID=UPI002FF0F19A